MVSHAIEVKVRWSEADPAGIVFYPRFFEWFDLATEALFESLELPWAEIFPKFRVVGVPIMESSARRAAQGQAVSRRDRRAPEGTGRHLRMKREIVANTPER